MLTSIGGDREIYGDYNSGTCTLSKNPNPKYTLASLTKNKSREPNSLITLLLFSTHNCEPKTTIYIVLGSVGTSLES